MKHNSIHDVNIAAGDGRLIANEVDITFILEGTYPYVLGGVSEWVHQIINHFPQYTFGLIFLGGAPENYKDGIRYTIPPNVKHFQTHYLFEDNDPPAPGNKLNGNEEGFEKIKQLHESFQCPHLTQLQETGDVSLLFDEAHGINYEQFLYGELSWDFIVDSYQKQCADSPFIDYFWTIKNIHKPLWTLANIVKAFPKSKLVHTVSTGYAGLLSFLVQRHFNYPVVLTEHGIYTRERKIDIFLSTTFHDDEERSSTEASYLRTLWDRFFITLSKLTYLAANPIVSLFEQAQKIQIEDGADTHKTVVIPNGVNITRFKDYRRPLSEKLPIICFVGRMVAMKDIKGFIRAIPYLQKSLPHYKFWIIGSTDQDPQYAQECHELVENILLQDVIEFKSHQNMADVLPKIQLLVLCAIRESMPLVVLESFAAGVPVVTTDVGACREMVIGVDAEDQALGPAGRVVNIANPSELAEAILEVISHPALWHQMSSSAITRVERYYDEQRIMDKYSHIYKEMTELWQA